MTSIENPSGIQLGPLTYDEQLAVDSVRGTSDAYDALRGDGNFISSERTDVQIRDDVQAADAFLAAGGFTRNKGIKE